MCRPFAFAGTCSAQLTIATNTATETGTFPITVSAAPLAHATVFNLTVSAPAGCGAVPTGALPPMTSPAIATLVLWAAKRLRPVRRRSAG